MKQITFILFSVCISNLLSAQGIHFSQFYNAPLLLNPANTGLTNSEDYRAGINYRNQYATIPVPFNTVSGFADFNIRRNEDANSWFGVGVQFWNDRAGVGQLSLNKIQGSLAFHIMSGERTSESFGVSVANINRSINFDKLSYDSQWDEFSYNNDLPNMENIAIGKTNYMDLQAGLSFTYNNNADFFIKTSASVMHLNQSKETFLNSSNRLGMRPIFSVEAEYKTNDNYILKPSAYYTSQKKASELVVGASGNLNLVRGASRKFNTNTNELLHGVYYRFGDALIFSTGYKYQNTILTLSYDHTISKLKQANRGFGAVEISIIQTGMYSAKADNGKHLGCPRF
jgi:type IX secretion system PorP/SprF family membrane protein